MRMNHSDRTKIFAAVRRARGDFSSTMTSILQTPVGTFTGHDVLEGFAADAEHLGKTNEDMEYFDQGFYKLCKLDNIYIFEITSEHPVKIPPMTI